MKITDSKACTGCTACASICPANAIEMLADEHGFLRPCINSKLCCNCGRCGSVCPVNKDKTPSVAPLKCFAARSRNIDLLKLASSGGIVTSIAKRFLTRGGVFYGCVLNGYKAYHRRIDDINALVASIGSKYIQSDLNGVFQKIKEDLILGKKVVFAGTPCQIAGLNGFLGDKKDQVLKVGLICHGVASPNVFARYCKELEKKFKLIMHSFIFRDKSKGWRNSLNVFVNDKGRIELGAYDCTPFGEAFITGACLRDSCRSCKLREGRSKADIIVGDFWGIEKVCNRFNDDRGVSCVVVYTKQGESALKDIDCEFEEVQYADVKNNNVNFSDRNDTCLLVERDPYRNFFMKAYKIVPLKLIKRFYLLYILPLRALNKVWSIFGRKG